MKLRRIDSQGALKALAKELGLRDDWHEPDNHELEAVCFGERFDNAGFWGRSVRETIADGHLPQCSQEMSVMLVHDGKPIAEINLASLFSMACGTWQDPER